MFHQKLSYTPNFGLKIRIFLRFASPHPLSKPLNLHPHLRTACYVRDSLGRYRKIVPSRPSLHLYSQSYDKDGWVLHTFQKYFSNFETMEGWMWKALCNDLSFRSGRISSPVGFEPALTRTQANRSEVGSANHSATSYTRKKKKMKEIMVLQNLLQCIYQVWRPPRHRSACATVQSDLGFPAVWNWVTGYQKCAHPSLVRFCSLNFSKSGLSTDWAHLLFCRYCCAPTNYAKHINELFCYSSRQKQTFKAT